MNTTYITKLQIGSDDIVIRYDIGNGITCSLFMCSGIVYTYMFACTISYRICSLRDVPFSELFYRPSYNFCFIFFTLNVHCDLDEKVKKLPQNFPYIPILVRDSSVQFFIVVKQQKGIYFRVLAIGF